MIQRPLHVRPGSCLPATVQRLTHNHESIGGPIAATLYEISDEGVCVTVGSNPACEFVKIVVGLPGGKIFESVVEVSCYFIDTKRLGCRYVKEKPPTVRLSSLSQSTA